MEKKFDKKFDEIIDLIKSLKECKQNESFIK